MRKEQRMEAEQIFLCRCLRHNGVVGRQVKDEWLTSAPCAPEGLLLDSPADANNNGLKLLDCSMALLAMVLGFWYLHLPSSRNTSIMFQALLNKVMYLSNILP
jgi:hypothetical protein